MKIIVNKSISKKIFVLITIFSVFLGILLLFTSIKSFIEVDILHKSKTNTAIITQADLKYSNLKREHYNRYLYVEYNYTVDNQTYYGNSDIWWVKKYINGYSKGDEIKIYYQIANPEKSNVYHISYFFTILSLLLIVFPVVALRERLKN